MSAQLPWNDVTEVAGVSFSDCRAYIIGGNRFATGYAGSTTSTAGGRSHTQRVLRYDGVANIQFGVRIPSIEATILAAARAAVKVKEEAAQAFRVHLQNAQYDIDVWAIPDYSQPSWLDHPEEAEAGGMVKDVKMYFVAQALYA